MAKGTRTAPRGGARAGISVAVTGAAGRLGAALCERLVADRAIRSVVALGLTPPGITHAKLRFQPLDLTASSADATVAETLDRHEVEALAHLPILTAVHDPAYAHEVEAIGTIRVLAGLATARTPRLVMVSTTSVYGAFPDNPNFLEESRPLRSLPGSRYLSDKVEMERQVGSFRATHPDKQVAVLRFSPIVGAGTYDPFAGYLMRRFAPVVLGYDPLVQLTHVEDALFALRQALVESVEGEFNVGSRGVMPLSSVLNRLRIQRVPLPYLGSTAALWVTNLVGLTQTPPALLDHVRHLCVADTRKAEAAGLGARHTIHEAVAALAQLRA